MKTYAHTMKTYTILRDADTEELYVSRGRYALELADFFGEGGPVRWDVETLVNLGSMTEEEAFSL